MKIFFFLHLCDRKFDFPIMYPNFFGPRKDMDALSNPQKIYIPFEGLTHS